MDGRRPPLFCQSPGNEEELPTTATGGKEGERGDEEGKDKGGLKVGNIEGRNESGESLRNARFGRVKLKLGRGIEML